VPPPTCWRPRLGAAAERDFAAILRWTAQRFGAGRARVYRQTLLLAVRDLASGPDVLGSKARDDILPGLRSLHVARRGRRGRHLLLYRAAGDAEIEILRILHDSMELRRHLPPAGEKI
jgi:toxin ParE1/3/4